MHMCKAHNSMVKEQSYRRGQGRPAAAVQDILDTLAAAAAAAAAAVIATTAAAAYLKQMEQNLQVGICELRLTQAKLLEAWHDRQGLCQGLAACNCKAATHSKNQQAFLFYPAKCEGLVVVCDLMA